MIDTIRNRYLKVAPAESHGPLQCRGPKKNVAIVKGVERRFAISRWDLKAIMNTYLIFNF